ncbi:ABC-F family ATP-binding cassette domain-containing protein [Caulobacter segnis]|uniref:ABC-F family ATP-binding cassette domain-containing protein n=1 Tax=Caulobacter segnis TaxID=88688 RepID=UPI0024102F02|nr:ABC-F family ATP-binding cassette domain-containing protein [Caulobacter segnis]MDG2522501.1 ABC-F family ATP-binding cassette domain-containing protein [Caulobacter segnis]
MSAFLTLDHLAARTPDGRPLFENLTLAFGPERTGLVGRNGVGKSTLLRVIAGEIAPSVGNVGVSGRIGVLRQNLAPPPGASVADLLGVAEALACLARIEAGEGDEADFSDADWTLPARLEQALAEVGLEGVDPSRPAATLSGGQATRAALARLLVEAPDLILLDEPTNNLDSEGRALVAQVLRGWRGGALVVSHDRDLLRQMDRIVELSSLGPKVYGGGYDLYAERKAEEQAAAERDLAAAERDSDRVAREAQAAREKQARRDGAGKRFAAKGGTPKIVLGMMAERAQNSGARGEALAERQREAAAERLESARERVEQVRELGFTLPSANLPAGRTVLALEDVSFGYGGEPILKGVSLRITGPERMAITGPNGRGKTTLLRLAAGRVEPTAGTVTRGGSAALLDQRTALLKDDETILQNFQRLNPAATQNDAHAALARFLFRNTAAHQVAGTLSGGERLRAGLACVLARAEPPQLLILDEPTNHLDLASIVAIEMALAAYDGAMLIVSHDPDFLRAVGVERNVEL